MYCKVVTQKTGEEQTLPQSFSTVDADLPPSNTEFVYFHTVHIYSTRIVAREVLSKQISKVTYMKILFT